MHSPRHPEQETLGPEGKMTIFKNNVPNTKRNSKRAQRNLKNNVHQAGKSARTEKVLNSKIGEIESNNAPDCKGHRNTNLLVQYITTLFS